MVDKFLDDNYEVPSTSNYMRYQDGVNRIRIMSSPILGSLYWTEDSKGGRKPVRLKLDQPITVDEIAKQGGDPASLKHFWAMVVWNYQDERIQILEITQKSIQQKIRGLAKDTDWGNPKNYDIVISKSGKSLTTKYEVQPKPAKPLEASISKLFKETYINLDALYSGDDPFSKQEIVNPDDVNI